MIELTEEQMQAQETASGPLRVVNTHTRQTFVLIPQDVYEKLCKAGRRPQPQRLGRPELDVYEQYRKKP